MRARGLKPGFFKNEKLASLHPLTRILFAGLWCMADREGRLEDRASRIKAEVLPYDDTDVDKMLTELDSEKFIKRYTVRGSKFIQIIKFQSHQHPHVREPASTIPAPGRHRASTSPAPDEPGPSTGPARRTPSFLTPHSLTPSSSATPGRHEAGTGPAPGSGERGGQDRDPGGREPRVGGRHRGDLDVGRGSPNSPPLTPEQVAHALAVHDRKRVG